MDLYRARWIIPIDREPIENGELLVHDGRIIEVGRELHAATATIHDLGDVILMPGFINAHTHLELSAYHDKLSPGPLWEWLDELVLLRRQPGAPEIERQAVLDGAAQSLAAGVTCIADISRTGMNIELLRTTPIRKVCFLELFSGARHPPNNAATLGEAAHKASRWKEPGRLLIGLSPHAPYSVAWDDLVATVELAGRQNLHLTMHLLETQDEQKWLSDGGGALREFLSRYGLPNAKTDEPKTVQDLLVRSGFLDLAPLLAHVNYADDELLSLLAESRATVVWCPRTHDFFGHRPHRWRDMLDAGINVCLGTDSRASAPSLSLLDEIRHLRRQAPDVSANLLLEMATWRAAVGLHLSDRIGSLAPGRFADLAAIEWDAAAPADPARNLLEGRGKIRSVWVEGRRVFHDSST